jgi:hypothetical protein
VRACLVVLVPKEHGGGKQWETSDASCDAIDRTTSPRERERGEMTSEGDRQIFLPLQVSGGRHMRRPIATPAPGPPPPSLALSRQDGASSFSYGGGGA